MPGKTIKTFYLRHKKNPLAVFLLKGFLFYALWYLVIYPWVITPSVHQWVIDRLVDMSVMALSWFFPMISGAGSEIFVHGKHCIHIGIPCNGIDVMGVFACIVMAFRAPWYHKLWVIAGGSITVFVLNVARIAGLGALLIKHHSHAFDINHKYVFNSLLYLVLLLIFSLWSTRYGIKTSVPAED